MTVPALLSDKIYSEDNDLLQVGNKRRHLRFDTRLRALYYVRDEQESLEKCEIVNVSYGGLGIKFNQAGSYKESLAINLGVVVKWQFVPISLKGRVTWLKEETNQPVGGVELDVPLDNMTLLKLF